MIERSTNQYLHLLASATEYFSGLCEAKPLGARSRPVGCGRQASLARHAFTLIEVLVTLAIMALIMLALQVTLHSTILTHDEIEIEIASVREGPRILDRIEEDLQSLHSYNIKDNTVFRGQSERHLSRRADRFDFISDQDSAHKVRDPAARQSDENAAVIGSDVTEVGYRLRPRTDGSDYLELYRREDLFVDEQPMEGGEYELLHDKISRFEITYLDQLGEEAEEIEEWDMAERKKLPAAVVIDLELQADPKLIGDFEETAQRAQNEYQYRRVIALDPSAERTMKLRPVIPVFIDPDEQKGGGGGGGGKKGGSLPGDGDGGAGGIGDGGGMKGDGEIRGGSDLKDRAGIPGGGGDGGQGGNRRRYEFDFNADGPGDFNDDQLSEEEKDMLQDFLDQYRNQYGGGDGGGFPF